MELFKSHVVCIGEIIRTTSNGIVHIDLGDVAGNPEVLSLEPEIGSKKGKKIPILKGMILTKKSQSQEAAN